MQCYDWQTRAKVSKVLRRDEKSLASILNYWVDDAVEKTDLSKTKLLSIDETQFKRGHSYVTVIIDGDAKKVVFLWRKVVFLWWCFSGATSFTLKIIFNLFSNWNRLVIRILFIF